MDAWPRAALLAFYRDDYAPVWGEAGGLNADALAALALLARARDYGLQPEYYRLLRLQQLRDSLASAPPARQALLQAELELGLSAAVLRFMSDISQSRLRSYAAFTGAEARARALRQALSQHTVPQALLAGQPTHRAYRQLQQALARWLAHPASADSLAGRQRGFEQAALNLERWRWSPIADSEYVLINIPAYELQVVAPAGMQRFHVIVGKPESPTPTLSSSITHFTLAPDWHVPHSIATREMLPRLKKDSGYLLLEDLQLYDRGGQLVDPFQVNWAAVTAQSFPYTIRQAAGCENALGNIVFRFANPYGVYVHDTPTRLFFNQPRRALSHGCVRLENPLQLAAYLLRRGGQPVELPSDEACSRQPRPRDVRLRRPMPLHLRYATCLGQGGQLRFLPDIYGLDEPLWRGLFGVVTAPLK
ncbi:hypothetical protein GCM10023185_20190 [Hymenobacter saemangeumensis]|uniref:L,D-TPase catalytic domain-containing protein n=1 Tax=Hymenobacter saemangeumensis TaxID=1084522 RepID=A0ABP8IDM4_9BACT